jgi:hypothetical protein
MRVSGTGTYGRWRRIPELAVGDPLVTVLAMLRLPLGEAPPDGVPTCESQHDPGEDSAPTADERSNRDEEKDRTQGYQNLWTFKELP